MLQALLLALAGVWPVGAEVILANPGLPSREDLVYARTSEGKVETLTVELALRDDGGVLVYEYASRASDAEVVARLDAASLFARQVESTTRTGEDRVRRTSSVLAARKPSPDAVLLAGFETMAVSLRSFPFGSQRKARLEFVGSPPGSFALEFTVLGRETVAAAGRGWECWKTQVGLGGVFSAFGKTTLWYSVAPPNILVRSEGASGPPGSPRVLMELRSYAASGPAWPSSPARK